jgi:short-subunit dehydrogenase
MSRVIAAGATSEALRPLLLRMASRGDQLTLIGRDPVALSQTASALYAAGAPYVSLQVVGADPRPADIRRAVLDAASAGPFDIALDFTGSFAYESSLDALGRESLFRVNCELPIAFLDAILPHMSKAGVVAIAGSVAAVRPRAALLTYARSKAALAAAIAERRLSIGRLIELRFGPLRTRMHPRRNARTAIDPARLVGEIDDALSHASGVVYLPRRWRLFATLLSRLPQSIVDRIG